MGQIISLTSQDGNQLSAYRADPTGTPRGGLVLVQEVFGVNSHIRSVADKFASEGYLVIAPALFDRIEKGLELGYTPDDVKRGVELKGKVSLDQALTDVAAAQKVAAEAGKVGIVGYCWGGLISWAAASKADGFACAVPYYGGGIQNMIGEQPKIPVMMHFGDQDHSIPLPEVEKIQAGHPDIPVHVYSAGHGFNCSERGSYDAEASAKAYERTLAFFRQHIG